MRRVRVLSLIVAAPFIALGCAGGDEVGGATSGGAGGYAGQSFGGESGAGGFSGGGTAGFGGTGGVAGAAGSAGGASGAGGTPTNDCCTPVSTPGCSSSKIQACVCKNEPYCCETSWHPMCVVSVNSLGCATCNIPGSGGSGGTGGGGTGGGGTSGGGTGGGGTSGGGSGGTGGTAPQCTGTKAYECGDSGYQCSASKCVKCATGLKNCNGLYSCECGGTCNGTACTTCTDPGPEPNNSTLSASSACPTSLCTLNDCDASGSSVAGVVKVGGDVDFFKFSGTDAICVVNPAISTTTSGIQACVFAGCKDASDGFKSCVKGVQASEGSLKGCCTSTPGAAEISLNCAGASDSATVYIRVKGNTATACVPYEVEYHF